MSQSRVKLVSIVIAVLLLLSPRLNLHSAERETNLKDPELVLQAYLRAIHARDFVEAYRLISSEDRRVRDLNRYVRQRGALSGFALEAARKLTEFIEIKPVQKRLAPDRIQALVRYKVPDPNKTSALLLNWDPYRLNLLPAGHRKQIIESLEKIKEDGSLEMIEVEEKLELVKEGDEWRIFLNWASGVKIPIRLDLSNAADLDVALSKNEVVVQPGDLFELFLKIKNRSKQPVSARIGHLIQPRELANFLDFVECGFLLPVTLEPEKEQEYSARYLLRESVPEGVHQLNLTYDFKLRRLLRLK